MTSLQFVTVASATGDPSLAIAGCRAGALGVLDLPSGQTPSTALAAIRHLCKHTDAPFGLRLRPAQAENLAEILADCPRLPTHILCAIAPENDGPDPFSRLAQTYDFTVLWEVASLHRMRDLLERKASGAVDGFIAKGHEAGGWVGPETTFILLQRLLKQTDLPVYAYGGVGAHTIAACAVAGAAGVVLDQQLALAKESPLPVPVKEAIARMDGSETLAVAPVTSPAPSEAKTSLAFRLYTRPNARAVQAVQASAGQIGDGPDAPAAVRAWQREVDARTGWGGLDESLWPMGQDAAFAATLAERYATVGGILQALATAAAQADEAAQLAALDADSPLAQAHGTRYPVVQGPMTRVSDKAEFVEAVAAGGGLPFLALSLMRGPDVETLLQETQARLGDRPWGVGILGFVPQALRFEQLDVIRRYAPPFAIIAGGRPDQARTLEEAGTQTYLHVPSPGLLRLFLREGARRFIFEGRECGGHVGPRSSFVLWNSMIELLLAELSPAEARDCSVLFAGGVHDQLSAAMVAAMAAPLSRLGVRMGVLMGTAYLFTQEAVSTGSILDGFQQEAIACEETVLLESGPGHATRCAPTDFVQLFNQERVRLQKAGLSSEDIRNALEELNVGRLRIASKGITRNPDYTENTRAATEKYLRVDTDGQKRDGLFMIGQVAALRNDRCTVEELHRQVSVESVALLRERSRVLPAAPKAAQPQPSQIAIVGMSGFLPKADTLQQFWANVVNGVDAISEVPPERWPADLYFDPDKNAPDHIYSRRGGFLNDQPFDPLAFGIPPNSLHSIDPLHLLALLAARDALSDAGYASRPFDRSRASVILGASGGTGDLGANYLLRSGLPLLFGEDGFRLAEEAGDALPQWTEDSFAGLLLNVAAGRIANRLDFGGYNYVVDAACASSLAALHLAVKELETGGTDLVVVGGVDTVQNPFGYLCFSKTQALSPTGEPRVFDADGDGIVISEGVVMLVIKRLADAQRDGDRIYAVIQAVAGSSDGRAMGMTAPRPEGQALALERAYAKAGFAPHTVGLFEAHGTGTVVGDQTEAGTLADFLRGAGAQSNRHAIGSVKSMIGHTKATAGVAGVAKAALALHHKVLPPTLRVQSPNPKAGFGDGPLYVNAALRPWVQDTAAHPRRAGVSAFGFGGTNFHTVLEEYTGDFLPDSQPALLRDWPAELLLWPRLSRTALRQSVQALAQALASGAQPPLADLAFSVSQLPTDIDAPADGLRLAIVATSLADLRPKLQTALAALDGDGPCAVEDPRGVYLTDAPLAVEGSVAFLFPGQGAQRPEMLSELALFFPEVRAALEEADSTLAGQMQRPLSSYIYPPPAFSDDERASQQAELTQTQIAQPAIGAVSAGALALLDSFGLSPAMTAGHSYGEYTALYAAGAVDLSTLIQLSAARGQAIVQAGQKDLGGMAAVQASAEQVQPLLDGLEGVWIANLNSPSQTILSGETGPLAAAVARCHAQNLTARSLPVACAFHSPLMAPATERLQAALAQAEIRPPRLPVFANASAGAYPQEPERIRTQLAQHLLSPVRFAAQVQAMYAAGARIFVEVGPGRILSGLVGQTLDTQPHAAIALAPQPRKGLAQFLHALARLAAHGLPVQPGRLFAGRDVQRLNLQSLPDPQPPQLPPTAWLVNGSRARPAHGPADVPFAPPFAGLLSPADGPSADGAAAGQSASAGAANPADSARQMPPTGVPAAEKPAPRPALPQPHSSPPVAQPTAGDPQVLARFNQSMSAFLETHRGLMLDFLQATGGVAPRSGQFSGGGRPANGHPPKAAPANAPGNGHTGQQPFARPGADASGAVPRSLLRWEETPHSRLEPNRLAGAGLIVISGDGSGCAGLLAARIRKLGGQAVVLADAQPGGDGADSLPVDWLSSAAIAGAVASARERHGPVAGVVHLRPMRPVEDTPQAASARALADSQELLALLQASGEDIRQQASQAGGWVVAVTPLGPELIDGEILAGVHPGQGGVGGFVKSVAREWPGVRCTALHTDPRQSVETVVFQILAEMTAGQQPGLAECGYSQAIRHVPVPVAQPLAGHAGGLQIGPDAVVLLTGGARGITAQVACALAEAYQPRLVLVGRSPAPPAQEDEATAGIGDPQALKRALMAQLRAAGETVSIPAVEAAYSRLLKEREMRHNLARMQAAGSEVSYHSLDVQDADGLAKLLAEVQSRYGRLDGVVHGAGVIEDRLIGDKSDVSLRRVIGTKVSGAFLFSHLLKFDSLQFFVLFSSASGVFGNRGQSDYAAANEVLNRLAARLDAQWPGRVVALNWGPWHGTGASGMVSEQLQAEFARRQIQLIASEAGCQAFLDELTRGAKGEPVVVLAGGKWQEPTGAAAPTVESRLPLLHTAAIEQPDPQTIGTSLRLDPTEHRYLLDHQLDGTPVLPFAVALELMAELAQAAAPRRTVTGVQSFQLFQGIALEDGPVDLRLAGRLVDGNQFRVEIYAGADAKRPSYRGVVEVADQMPPPSAPGAAPANLTPFPLSVDDAYARLLFHGPLFQGIETIAGISPAALVADCRPAAPAALLASQPSGDWLIDPVIFDSALQLIILWRRLQQDETPLPNRFARLQRFGPLGPGPIRCILRGDPAQTGSNFAVTIEFHRPDGTLAALLEEMECSSSPALNRLTSKSGH